VSQQAWSNRHSHHSAHPYHRNSYRTYTKKTFSDYHHEHGGFDPSLALKWCQELGQYNQASLLYEAAHTPDALGHPEWIEVLQQSLGKHRLDCHEQLIQAIEEKRSSSLKVLCPMASSSANHRALDHALDRNDAQCVDVLLPYANPKSGNCELLQRTACLLGVTEGVLERVINISQPGKAARHLIYKDQSHAADQIMSNSATPIELLKGVIEYAHSRQMNLPLSQARLSKHELGFAVFKKGDDALGKRRM
jgi:hypothetical protein